MKVIFLTMTKSRILLLATLVGSISAFASPGHNTHIPLTVRAALGDTNNYLNDLSTPRDTVVATATTTTATTVPIDSSPRDSEVDTLTTATTVPIDSSLRDSEVSTTTTATTVPIELSPRDSVVATTTTTTATIVPINSSASLLDAALKSNVTAASSLLAQLNELRSSSDGGAATEAFLANLLDEVDDSSKTPWWSRLPMLTRFSRRARRASLRRVLDLSTPSVSETESFESDDDADRRRRRRSFVIILRSLANLYEENEVEEEETGIKAQESESKSRVPAIVTLEKAAKREAKATVQSGDMANRVPKGLETPKYTVLSERKQYEVRRYDPFSVCSVVMNKPRPVDATKTDATISNPQLSGASSFGALAGYLFGKNEQETAMKMTTPVLSRGDGETRQMSFILPSDYWNGIETAPKPLEGSGVVLERDEGGEQAVVMFGGFAGKSDVEERTKQLLDGLNKDKEWQVDPVATVNLAQYNDPFTPPWKRRNEVSIKVLQVKK